MYRDADEIYKIREDIVNTLKWIKVTKERLDEINDIIEKAKNNGLKAVVEGKIINLNDADDLLDSIYNNLNSKNIKDETTDLYKKIVEDSTKIVIANKTNATESRLKT